VAREIQVHSGLVHDHIIALYGAFEDGKHVYLVQEFAPGMLSFILLPEPAFTTCAAVCRSQSARETTTVTQPVREHQLLPPLRQLPHAADPVRLHPWSAKG
jgi:serine/threonine protein kinase